MRTEPEQLFDDDFVREMRRKWEGYITYPHVWQVVRGQTESERNLRAWLEEQWRAIPSKHKRASLRGDLRSENMDPPQHLGGRFELITRAWLLQASSRVTVEPKLQGTGRRPDLRVWLGRDQSYIVECVVRSVSAEWADIVCSWSVKEALQRRLEDGVGPALPWGWWIEVHLSPWQVVSETQVAQIHQLAAERLSRTLARDRQRFVASLRGTGLKGRLQARRTRRPSLTFWTISYGHGTLNRDRAAALVLQRVTEKAQNLACVTREPLAVAVHENMVAEWTPSQFAKAWRQAVKRLPAHLSSVVVCSPYASPQHCCRYVLRVFHNSNAEHPLPLDWLPPCEHYIKDGKRWRWVKRGESFVDCVPGSTGGNS